MHPTQSTVTHRDGEAPHAVCSTKDAGSCLCPWILLFAESCMCKIVMRQSPG